MGSSEPARGHAAPHVGLRPPRRGTVHAPLLTGGRYRSRAARMTATQRAARAGARRPHQARDARVLQECTRQATEQAAGPSPARVCGRVTRAQRTSARPAFCVHSVCTVWHGVILQCRYQRDGSSTSVSSMAGRSGHSANACASRASSAAVMARAARSPLRPARCSSTAAPGPTALSRQAWCGCARAPEGSSQGRAPRRQDGPVAHRRRT